MLADLNTKQKYSVLQNLAARCNFYDTNTIKQGQKIPQKDGVYLEVSSNMIKFSVSTKLFRVIKTKRDVEELQKDLSRLREWVVKWQMQFLLVGFP